MKHEDIRKYFRSQSPSETQKTRMLAGVLEQYKIQQQDCCTGKGDMNMNVKMKHRILKVTVIAAILTLTAVSAFAEVPAIRDWIGSRFGLSAEQEQVLAASGTLQNIEASVSDDIRTLTVRQTLADENGMYIVFDVDSQDGSKVDANLDDFEFRIPDYEGVLLHGLEYQVLEERLDGATCMAMLFGLENLSGQKVELTSCGLTCQWTVGNIETAKNCEADLWGTDAYDGSAYHVTGYSLSPLFLKLDLEYIDDMHFAGPDLVELEVKQADGTEKIVTSGNSIGKTADGLAWNLYIFDEVIDVDAVQAVYVDGVKLN